MTAARALLPIDVLVGMLAGRAEQLCRELLPDGKRCGHEWVAPSRWGGSQRSLSVHLTGSKAGVWRDFATGDKGGDALSLVAELVFGGDVRQALPWARAWLGLDGAPVADIERMRKRAQVQTERAREQDTADAERRRRQAQAMWLNGQPIDGTPAEAYLRARGIDWQALPHKPATLRFAPACWCSEVKRELPAMLAAIADKAGRHVATHRTYLAETADEDGLLTWRKAQLQAPKKVLGDMRGGFIRLTRGTSGRPWRDMHPDETVAIAEGIETALSVALCVPEWRVLSCVSLSNLLSIDLPDSIADVVMCADNDQPNSAAVVTLKKALDYLLANGRQVRLARPEPGVKDWNDALKMETAG
jgi:hypothetical protein